MAPKYRRPRIMFICEQEAKDFLEGWASSENRTVSNLVETLVTEAITVKQSGRSDKEALELALDLLNTMIEGKPPTLAQIAKLAHETDLKEEDLLKLRELIAKGKAANGT
jgi:hypothetical protein